MTIFVNLFDIIQLAFGIAVIVVASIVLWYVQKGKSK